MDIREETYKSFIKFVKEYRKEKPVPIKECYKHIQICGAITQIISNIEFKNKTYKEICEDTLK